MFCKYYSHCFFVTSASTNTAAVLILDLSSLSISRNVCSWNVLIYARSSDYYMYKLLYN